MALNQRRVNQISSENNHILKNQPGKVDVTKAGLGVARRPVFREIKNHIPENNKVVLKKPLTCIGPKPNITGTNHVMITQQKNIKKTTTISTTITAKVGEAPKKEIIRQPEIIEKPKDTLNCSITDLEVRSYSTKRIEEDLDDIQNESVVIEDNPENVAEYVNDIYDYLRKLEMQYPIDEKFLSCHKTNPRMRSILVNWLIELHFNWSMFPETLHLCIQILDRYLQKNKSVGRDNLQLVGVTALWIAGKYEEMYNPELHEFVYMGDNSFTGIDMRKMEFSIIKALDFNFGRPLSVHFLRRYSKVGMVELEEHQLAKYFLELQLLNYELCSVKPSIQAAAAYFLSCSIIREITNPHEIWTRDLITHSTYTYFHFDKVVQKLAKAQLNNDTMTKYPAIRKKFSYDKNCRISLMPDLQGSIIKNYAALN